MSGFFFFFSQLGKSLGKPPPKLSDRAEIDDKEWREMDRRRRKNGEKSEQGERFEPKRVNICHPWSIRARFMRRVRGGKMK